MPAPIIPWQPSNVPQEIQEELNRRKINRSYRFVQNEQANWTVNSDGASSWKAYRGPMTSWIRMCSNGAGHPNYQGITDKERFVLFSGKGFYQSYGFQPSTSREGTGYQVIGYTPGDKDGKVIQKHIIYNSLTKPIDEPTNYPIHVPPPEISKMEVIVQKELFRRATIEWVCFSWKQLVYMTPYFLVPGITCMVEWGWNHYNVKSLVNLGDIDLMQKLWDNAYPLYFNNILYSNGNYDVIYGIVTNFNWSIEGNKIICSTEITSKDRLYTGIAKDHALSVRSRSDADIEDSNDIFQSIKDFFTKDDTLKSLKTIVTTTSVAKQEAILTTTGTGDYKTWYDILNPLLVDGTDDIKDMRSGYVFGVFSGRDASSRFTELGPPKPGDWDERVGDSSPTNIWINMGLVCQILNYFSAKDSGAGNGKNEFYVDIQNSVIGAHPNMISCDARVLIPNSGAPKYQWGTVGKNARFTDHQYQGQHVNITSFDKTDKNQIPNAILAKTFYQFSLNTCYRNDIDHVINYNRIQFAELGRGGWSFPSDSDDTLPKTIRGLNKNAVERRRSGLLSNIYIRYDLLKAAIDAQDDGKTKNSSYVDIYNYLFKVMQSAVDGFWELALVDVEGVFTITDRKYVGKYSLDNGIDSNGEQIASSERVYSFDYYDADSIIKSMKFRPQLSDAQAARTIYGEVNNKNSKYKYLDKNDVLDYKFSDAVIGNIQSKITGDVHAELTRRGKNKEHQSMVEKVQTIKAPDPVSNGFQMSLLTEGGTNENPNIVKLILPDPQLLRMLLNDGDLEGNARYCAVQPGIILELTLLGVGGLRTFQYFTVKNLPEPYSDRNIIFRITDVHQTLEAGSWETTIRAQPLPLRAYIKQRLKGPIKDSNIPNENGWPLDATSNRSTSTSP